MTDRWQKKVLITGFTPFGSEKENPSQIVVEAFDDTSCGVEVVKAILPVSFAKAGKMIVDFIEDVRPDVVICLGQAGGRNEPSIERIAVNLNMLTRGNNKVVVTLLVASGANEPAYPSQIHLCYGGKKGGEIKINGNKKVGNFEKEVLEEYGIKVQVAKPDDSGLSNNDITISAAGKEK